MFSCDTLTTLIVIVLRRKPDFRMSSRAVKIVGFEAKLLKDCNLQRCFNIMMVMIIFLLTFKKSTIQQFVVKQGFFWQFWEGALGPF